MSRFLLVGGGPKGLDVKIISEWGFEVVCFDLFENIRQFHENFSKARAVYGIKDPKDYNSIIKLAQKTYNEAPFVNAISFTEWGLLPTAMIVDFFKFKGNSSDAVKLTINKYSMREILSNYGLSKISFSEVGNVKEFYNFCQTNDHKGVLKFKEGSGKKGIFVIRNNDDFRFFEDEMVEAFKTYGEMLAEQFMCGQEYSVETFSWDGDIKFITYTKKYNLPPRNVEVGHTIPALLDGEMKLRIKNYVEKCFNVLNIKYGTCHTEIIVNGNEINMVETHVRPGGDYIYDLLLYAHSVDVIRIACDYASGNPVDILPKVGFSAGIKFFHPPEGRYSEITGQDYIKLNPIVKQCSFVLPKDGFLKEIKGNKMTHSYFIACDQCSSEKLDFKMDEMMKHIKFVRK